MSAADRNAALLLVVHGIDSVDPFIVPAGWEPEPNDLQDPPRVDAPPELKAALQRRFQQELAAASQVAAITWPGESRPLSHLQQQYTPTCSSRPTRTRLRPPHATSHKDTDA